jgi:cytochrome c biogenesis factor
VVNLSTQKKLKYYIKIVLTGILLISSAYLTYILLKWNPYILIDESPKYYFIPYHGRQFFIQILPWVNSLLLILPVIFYVIKFQKTKLLFISFVFNACTVLFLILLPTHYPVCTKKYSKNSYLFWEQGWQQDCSQFKRWKSDQPSDSYINYDHATWHIDSTSFHFK